MNKPLRILVADDHAIFRRGLKEIITDHFRHVEVEEAETAHRALESIRKKEPDVAVLDITMPDRSGLEILAELKKANPKVPVLILSAHPEEQYAVRVLKAGAAGYLTKANAPNELVDAVNKVLAGGKYITPTLAEKLAAELTGKDRQSPHDRLSDREYQIMRMIALGKSVKNIATELCLTVQTVSTHRARLLKKMGLQTNAELMRYALQRQLVE
jgi:DNA-binding NarL/FixJ family response regulator